MPADGPEPVVRTWPGGDRPGMRVRLCGQWRRGVVVARMDWPDRLAYQVTVSMGGVTTDAGSGWIALGQQTGISDLGAAIYKLGKPL